jgi:hypothetical protein
MAPDKKWHDQTDLVVMMTIFGVLQQRFTPSILSVYQEK